MLPHTKQDLAGSGTNAVSVVACRRVSSDFDFENLRFCKLAFEAKCSVGVSPMNLPQGNGGNWEWVLTLMWP